MEAHPFLGLVVMVMTSVPTGHVFNGDSCSDLSDVDNVPSAECSLQPIQAHNRANFK